ncbi:putative O-glycosylation ligase, exosortase A system-associated [Sphingomonas oligophenolica]|uniref:Putative O-glycosylation ligase, exosortase A system-associated n=1 Tax=Sphingomonas oligophenolica TaxID=301154 RepID=A0A502CT68_9SPHN|nr:putative O-glycosylation ligase, exosortase A system-associated [Sphingomonas oligophenolica]TPG15289.1 putative O-glycosylation ligase, exosortase A system-associated [Sphingomonas oligophenolica]
MHDLIFLGFLAALFAAGLRKPFLLVLTYVYIDVVSPQRLTYYLLNSVPISLIAVAMAVGGFLIADKKADVRFAPRQALIVLLLLYCGMTTMSADFPIEAADKWEWVWKALAFAAFLPLTLRTKLRIEALLLFMVLSAATIIIVGGIKTAAGGGGYGELDLMVTNNSGLYESSTISAVAIAIIPLILWFMKYGTIFPPDWKVKTFGFALIFSCLLMPIGTSARTGLLCIVFLALVMFRLSKRKLAYIAATVVLAVAAVPLLPSSFTQRMDTIKTHQGDESASTRIAVWAWTIGYAKAHPFGGGFNAFLQNKVRYELRSADGDAAGVTNDKARAYHSAYFEMLGEQGYPGLAIWLIINLAGVWRMEVIRRRHRDPDDPYAWGGALAAALQSGHLIYLLGGAFVGIAFQPFIYMLIGAQIGLDTYLTRKRGDTIVTAFRPVSTKAVIAPV